VKLQWQDSRLAGTTETVDAINRAFYGRFQFPQPPVAFDAPVDPSFETTMLNQSLGDWDHTSVAQTARFWVAGCGTNQAVFAGLRFPNATIVASDLSEQSLASAGRSAQALGVHNIEFRNESVNSARYREEFDFIICTGVIHHNADPREPLSRLAAALRPAGFMELMVYNRYHRVSTTAFQKAIRLLRVGADFEDELRIAQAIARSLRSDGSMDRLLESQQRVSESQFADALLQPVEHSYTVESLQQLLAECGLELLLPCINQYDKAAGQFHWNLEFADSEVAARYLALPDPERWKITHHLLLERGPFLWFYVGRRDSGRQRRSEGTLCREFLERCFTRSATQKKLYLKDSTGLYQASPKLVDYPGTHPNEVCRRVIESHARQPQRPMGAVFDEFGLSRDFMTTNKLRLYLTTSSFPFLIAA
jgi:SAM-dependent methyltransferase